MTAEEKMEKAVDGVRAKMVEVAINMRNAEECPQVAFEKHLNAIWTLAYDYGHSAGFREGYVLGTEGKPIPRKIHLN